MNIKIENFNLPVGVYCPTFSENRGGAIVLHYLVDRLRALNVDAYAIPQIKHYPDDMHWLLKRIKQWNYKYFKKFKTHSGMNVPVLNSEIPNDMIIIYPEVISGNPMNAKNVVRWLLHKPGFFGVGGNYSENDEFFFFNEVCRDDKTYIPKDNLLYIFWLREDIYYDCSGGQRSGSCRMLRKGEVSGIVDIPDNDKSILLDGKSHEQIAKIFRKTEFFYCHDPMTFYCYLAAVSGCIPIIIPQPGVSSKAWRNTTEIKFGIAYGLEEVDWARKTRSKMIDEMVKIKENEEQNLLLFLGKLQKKFGQ